MLQSAALRVKVGMKTATFVDNIPKHKMRGDARLYKLSEPMKDYNDVEADYVIVSAVVAFDNEPETYIFPANAFGEILSWLEMDGSFRGELNHAQALLNAGYTIAGE